ncbi:MoxR family ATPase [Pseudonocardia xishanensis]|uniref:MoxR family ATPase n=1 Tax=Pseudonocardia xishanensis TaxID=630995 RepID=A0ABP8S105_9PSEU
MKDRADGRPERPGEDRAARRPTTPVSIEELTSALEGVGYFADRGLATALFLALRSRRPLLLEGEAGVGKTEAAKALRAVLDADLIRLQCYEGIDARQALYDWDYPRQLLAARLAHESGPGNRTEVDDLYGPEFITERPLLRALRAGERAVLLVDEIDRADDQFEALMLELLSDFTISVPEMNETIRAAVPPVVVLTSNRTRELHDALRRRCAYVWIDPPDAQLEIRIVRARLPGIEPRLADSVATAVARIRKLDLLKVPGIAETLDWARALAMIGAHAVTVEAARATLGWVVKTREDTSAVGAVLDDIVVEPAS